MCSLFALVVVGFFFLARARGFVLAHSLLSTPKYSSVGHLSIRFINSVIRRTKEHIYIEALLNDDDGFDNDDDETRDYGDDREEGGNEAGDDGKNDDEHNNEVGEHDYHNRFVCFCGG